ncbi:hypothetical protein H072_6454 [Dactylellina haptotyla CBS 200.50]|uniref:Uncharacterized protein n=1 Tax=Dactylellina haptotyla (strain CBS 200.50) TaxID=1284197 RepID=S8BWM3_DACHA|nr:hypothetical protein H072_6454 [Dactylellina haptotyla CBS 200.50]
MKFTLCLLAIIGATTAVPNPIADSVIQKRCTAGTELYYWCKNACGYNCRAQYNSCRSIPGPGGCSEAYSRMVSYCTTCCEYGDCVNCQNCGNSYGPPPV